VRIAHDGLSLARASRVDRVTTRNELSEDMERAVILTFDVAGVLRNSGTNERIYWTGSGNDGH
jgi:hypothetical protein